MTHQARLRPGFFSLGKPNKSPAEAGLWFNGRNESRAQNQPWPLARVTERRRRQSIAHLLTENELVPLPLTDPILLLLVIV
jgi:hypothetical protein